MPFATISKTLVFTAFLCPKHWYLQRFRLFVQHTAQGCGTGQSVTSVHAFHDHAQTTAIYSVLCPKHSYLQRCRLFGNVLRKDVEQEKLRVLNTQRAQRSAILFRGWRLDGSAKLEAKNGTIPYTLIGSTRTQNMQHRTYPNHVNPKTFSLNHPPELVLGGLLTARSPVSLIASEAMSEALERRGCAGSGKLYWIQKAVQKRPTRLFTGPSPSAHRSEKCLAYFIGLYLAGPKVQAGKKLRQDELDREKAKTR